MDGDEGRPVGLVVESVRFSWPGIMGLDSRDGDGEATLGDCNAELGLLCDCIASARSF